jgi:hypothetical protein
MSEENRFVCAANLAKMFEGLSFNLEKMRVVLPNGQLVHKAQFDVIFGGHIWALDQHNERITRSAWKAFTANEAFRPPIIFK